MQCTEVMYDYENAVYVRGRILLRFVTHAFSDMRALQRALPVTNLVSILLLT